MHKFELEPYRTAKSRHTCPSCGNKNQLARYIMESGEYLADHVGRCNKESSCNYHYTPKQYFIDNPTLSKLSEYKPVTALKPKNVLTIGLIDKSVLNRTLGIAEQKNNTLFSWLCKLFLIDKAVYLFDLFLIGTTKKGQPIFWQVDEYWRVRAGKIRPTNPETGKGLGTDWIHSRMKKAGLLNENFNLSQCLFGLHQINYEHNKGKDIALVEGEKTAVVMSALYPDFIWMATGGCGNFNIDNLKPIKSRVITVHPDAGAFTKWEEKAKEAKGKGFIIAVSNLLEQKLEKGECSSNDDFLDVYLEQDKTGLAIAGGYPVFWD